MVLGVERGYDLDGFGLLVGLLGDGGADLVDDLRDGTVYDERDGLLDDVSGHLVDDVGDGLLEDLLGDFRLVELDGGDRLGLLELLLLLLFRLEAGFGLLVLDGNLGYFGYFLHGRSFGYDRQSDWFFRFYGSCFSLHYFGSGGFLDGFAVYFDGSGSSGNGLHVQRFFRSSQ